jgi:hypothetical protein
MERFGIPDTKDVILEMLCRHGVDGGIGEIIEYYDPSLESLSAMDRHVIANMGCRARRYQDGVPLGCSRQAVSRIAGTRSIHSARMN